MRPLSGLTVVAVEHAVAAPLATRQLADLGARVIKVERPGSGDFARAYDRRARGLSSHFVHLNRGKQSLALDLKHPRAPVLLRRLVVEQADVLVQNLAPGAAARLGLSHEALAAAAPRLIVCDISGYGSDGPYRDKKAYDLLIQSESGVLSVTGMPEAPAKAGLPVADIAAGMHAAQAILAALLQRAIDGRGRRLDISMLEATVEWMGYPMYYTLDGASPPPRTGAAHATIYPYGPFRAGDGQVVMLGVQNEREWRAFCTQVLRQPALADDERFADVARRSAARATLDEIVSAAFAGLTAAQVVARLDDAGIANARVNTMAEVWAHPQLAARGRWTTIGSPVGPLPALRPPGLADDEADVDLGAIPALGEHTRAILAELGVDGPTIDDLRAQGAI
jgi:crotonobetainyl-CoA:carnitine CoA-transferase CaiB-like acyl-CoA transferase